MSPTRSVSDIKVCAIAPVSVANDGHKQQDRHHIFNRGTLLPHGLNTPFSFLNFFRKFHTFFIHVIFKNVTW